MIETISNNEGGSCCVCVGFRRKKRAHVILLVSETKLISVNIEVKACRLDWSKELFR